MTDAKLELLLTAKNMADNAFDKFDARLKGIDRGAALVKASLAGIAAGFSLDVAVRGIDHFVDSASDMEEALSKVNTLFGPSATRDIEAWAQGASKAMGLSERAALDATGSIGNMFLQLGAGRTQAADTSKSMVQLAADLASFHNAAGGAEGVLNAMQSAFRGEYDALQRYIYTINAASVQHTALAMTGKSAAKDLTQLEKAAAAVEIITRDAGVATGDFLRTIEGHANATRRLDTAWENLSSTLGQKFVKSAAAAKGALADLLEAGTETLRGPSIDDRLAEAAARMTELQIKLEEKRTLAAESASDRRQRKMDEEQRKREERYAWQAEADRRVTAMIKRNVAEIEEARSQGEQRRAKDPLEIQIESTSKLIEELKRLKTESNIDDLLTDAFDLSTVAVKGTDDAVQDLDRAMKDFFGAIDRDAESITKGFTYRMREADNQLKEFFTDLDRMEDSVRQANLDNAITWEFFDIDQEEAKLRELQKETESTAEAVKNAITGWGSQFSGMLTDAIFDAELSFDKIFESFARMLTQMVIQKQVVEPLLTWGTSFLKNAHGNAFDQSGVIPFASGGVVTRPTIFPFASGIGLMGEAGPEGILPLKRTSSGDLGVQVAGGGGINVETHIHNNVGAQVKTTQTKTADGVRMDVMIDQAMANNAAQFGTLTHRAMRQNGMPQPLIGR